LGSQKCFSDWLRLDVVRQGRLRAKHSDSESGFIRGASDPTWAAAFVDRLGEYTEYRTVDRAGNKIEP
jgi:hypothetical protein